MASQYTWHHNRNKTHVFSVLVLENHITLLSSDTSDLFPKIIALLNSMSFASFFNQIQRSLNPLDIICECGFVHNLSSAGRGDKT